MQSGRNGLMSLYVEQDVNLAKQSCSGLKNVKIKEKCKKNPGKNCLAVRIEWVKNQQPLCLTNRLNQLSGQFPDQGDARDEVRQRQLRVHEGQLQAALPHQQQDRQDAQVSVKAGRDTRQH